uniref:GGDEF domain-containing protein n=1 Tax=Thaumasiovibrio occultus TaxID=1891184 RepID=UPI00131DBA39|nr:GGDEF domain-containing protein [Thaumasiovibrio occultus]
MDWKRDQHREFVQGLCRITEHAGPTLRERIAELLCLGLRCFVADLALVSRIEGECYHIEYVEGENCGGPQLSRGQRWRLSQTLAQPTWRSQHLHISRDIPMPLPKLCAGLAPQGYLAAPIKVSNTPFGVLEFLRYQPAQQDLGVCDGEALRLLSAWIGSEITRTSQETVLRRVNHRLMRQALTDPLTGLANRRAMFSHLRREANRLYREHREGCIALIDIDFFKRFNDTHGHQQGDIALRMISKAMKHVLRDFDFLARYGGEEFLLWLPEQKLSVALTVCERIRDKVASLTLFPEKLSVSIGVATLALTHQTDVSRDIDAAIAAADAQLFIAKAAGRNCIRAIEGH